HLARTFWQTLTWPTGALEYQALKDRVGRLIPRGSWDTGASVRTPLRHFVMPMSSNDGIPVSQVARQFASTRWSLVAAAAQRDSPESEAALAPLCRLYWYPLYAYARRRLPQPQDAQDQTQAFFACLLDKDYLQQADRERGRFRAFLLT